MACDSPQPVVPVPLVESSQVLDPMYAIHPTPFGAQHTRASKCLDATLVSNALWHVLTLLKY